MSTSLLRFVVDDLTDCCDSVIYGPLGSARAKAFADQSERVDPREISLPVVIIKK